MTIRKDRPAYLALKRKVLEGRFYFGRQIDVRPIEIELGISAIPVREALIELAAEDLVDFDPGKGFFSKDIDLNSSLNQLDMLRTLLCDCASSLDASPVRKLSLKRRLASESSQLRAPITQATIFERVLLLSELFETYFHRPYSHFSKLLIGQCATLLYVDNTVHETKLVLSEAIFDYFRLASSNRVEALKSGLGNFVEVRKARLPATIVALHDHVRLGP